MSERGKGRGRRLARLGVRGSCCRAARSGPLDLPARTAGCSRPGTHLVGRSEPVHQQQLSQNNLTAHLGARHVDRNGGAREGGRAGGRFHHLPLVPARLQPVQGSGIWL